MKKIVLSAFCFCLLGSSQAQGVDEWLSQKQTQIKYYLQQITLLQTYLGNAKKGYSLAKTGLNSFKDFKKGEFANHQDYFNSLKNINPAIKKSAKISEIISFQLRSAEIIKKVKKNSAGETFLVSGDINYINKVSDNVLYEGNRIIDELICVTSRNIYEMTDDERIKKVDQLYFETQSMFSYLTSFSDDLVSLILCRRNEKKEILFSEKVNGLP